MLQVPKLTIIMPVYNTAQYLPRAFDALLKQVNKAFKLIVVDDGSTDNSVEVAQSYASRFPYFKLIQKENGGPSDARNVGIKYIDTPYVTFHDGDDWVDPGYTAFFINAFEEHPNVNLVSCGYWIDYPDKKERIVGHPGGGFLTRGETYIKLTNVFGSPMKGYSWNKAYKTAIINKYHLRFDCDISLLEDQIFNVKYTS
ncbi:MAG: glycosyltransferase family 2 protein, partial [Lactobacillus sp.]|nr:glycosyltransferase family 2 protein [Lactobacillus sp.]